MWSVLVLFLRKKWDARRQAYRPLFGEIYQQKISGVMHLKHYPWVVNLFLCGRVWQLYGSWATVVVVCKIVVVGHRFCWGVVVCGSRYGVAGNPSVILVWSRYMMRFSVFSFADLSQIMRI
jgi:hypothetical protein